MPRLLCAFLTPRSPAQPRLFRTHLPHRRSGRAQRRATWTAFGVTHPSLRSYTIVPVVTRARALDDERDVQRPGRGSASRAGAAIFGMGFHAVLGIHG